MVKKITMVWLWSGKEATIEDILLCVGNGWTPLVRDLVKNITALGDTICDWKINGRNRSYSNKKRQDSQ